MHSDRTKDGHMEAMKAVRRWSAQRPWVITMAGVFLLNLMVVTLSQNASIVAGQDELGYVAKANALLGNPIGFPSKYASGTALFLVVPVIVAEATGSQYLGWMLLIAVNSVALTWATASCVQIYRSIHILKIQNPQHEVELNTQPSVYLWVAILAYPPVLLAASTTLATVPLTLAATSFVGSLLLSLHTKSWTPFVLAAFWGFLAGLIHPTAVLLFPVTLMLITPLFLHANNRGRRQIAVPAILGIFPILGFLTDRAALSPYLNRRSEGVAGVLSASYGDTTGRVNNYISKILSAPISLNFYLMLASTLLVYWSFAGFTALKLGQNNHGKSTNNNLSEGNCIGDEVDDNHLKFCNDLDHRSRGLRGYAELALARYLQYVWITLVGVGIVSLVIIRYTTERRRMDDWFYLRYHDPFVFFPLLLAISGVFVDTARWSKNKVLFLMAAVVLVPIAIDLRLPGPQDDLFFYNNAGFWVAAIRPWSIGIALTVFLLVALTLSLSSKTRRLFPATILILALLATLNYRSVEGAGHSRETNLVPLAAELASGRCIGLDLNVPVMAQDGLGRRGLDIFRVERTSFLALDLLSEARRIGVTDGCDSVVLSYDMDRPGKLVARDLFGGMGLFVSEPLVGLPARDWARLNGGASSTIVISEHLSESCLRKGCFRVNGSALASSGAEPGLLMPGTISHGPYSSLAAGKWFLTISLLAEGDFQVPSTYLTGANSGSRFLEQVSLDWQFEGDRWTGQGQFTIHTPLSLFEVVIETTSDKGQAVIETVEVQE